MVNEDKVKMFLTVNPATSWSWLRLVNDSCLRNAKKLIDWGNCENRSNQFERNYPHLI